MPVFNLVINSSNVIGSSNSKFQYKFIDGTLEINPESEICVSQVVIPYSWFNISNGYYNNDTLSYFFPGGAGYSNEYFIILQDGFYTINDFSNYILGQMFLNNQYLINNTTGENVYYMQLLANPTYYSNQLLCFATPTSLPTGYSEPPAGFNNNPLNIY